MGVGFVIFRPSLSFLKGDGTTAAALCHLKGKTDAIEAQVNITLVKLADMLRRDQGACFAPSTVWRFLDRHAMTVKKRRTPASRSGPTLLGGG
ncbi:MAG: hypothetical protein EXR09_05220 [Acetobacteraceae bacterium]|nr:hypothetical protein [Acetobacteraceae bacterium]